MNKGKTLLKDAGRKKKLFFIKANDEAVYTGFPLIKETETDGFIYGAITDFLTADNENGCMYGDGFIQAPDGSRAGLEWRVSSNVEIETLLKPEDDRWGVYGITFPKPIKTLKDLTYNFRKILPLLKDKYESIK